MEKTITRNINLYADPVPKKALVIGGFYFETSFLEESGKLLPVMNTFILVDIEENADDGNVLYVFEQMGLWYLSKKAEKIKLSYEELSCFYTFDVSLDILLGFISERRQD